MITLDGFVKSSNFITKATNPPEAEKKEIKYIMFCPFASFVLFVVL